MFVLPADSPSKRERGSIRRHHFAHVSNYECMYASEVAIYKALAAELEKTDCLTLPPVMLRFPAWSKDELLQNVKTVRVDSVEFKCEPLAYPPLLTIKAQGSCLRILLDFNHYYDSEDLASLATEAKNDGYSLLKFCKIGYPTSIRSGERMKKRSCCAKSEKDISNEDQSILVQHRMLLGMWSHPVLRKRSWMPGIYPDLPEL